MSSYRRFFPLDQEESIFSFTIDTSKVNPSGTDGSENPLTFKMPMATASIANATTNCVVSVSDGRADFTIIGNAESGTKSLLTFATAGVYEITIKGRVGSFNFISTGIGYDKLKITSIDYWGWNVNYGTRAFYGCSNLEINATNTLVLPPDTSWFFRDIKGFNTPLSLINTQKVTDAGNMLSGITSVLQSTLSPFWQSLTSVVSLYSNITFGPDVNRIEIISNSITSLSQPWSNVTFQNTGTIELVCDTPNLTQMYRVFFSGEVKTRCHAGRIDVRNVTDTNSWLIGTLTKAQVDATLLGWANLPFMQSGVTWNWNGSKYSNNPEVIGALNKITGDWGVIFTNLTME